MNQYEQFISLFYETGALKKGHFLLSSGNHSDTYFQCALVLQFPEHAARIGNAVAEAWRNSEVDVVVSPAIGGIVAGQEVARSLGARAIFCEREQGRMSFRRGFFLDRGEKVLVVEDVITTGGSVREVVDAVRDGGGEVVGVSCIVNRSGCREVDGFDIASLVTLTVPIYPPESCPLCRDGIPADKPGSRNKV
jgi:orotate phosphoribosyltransferase